MVPNIFHNLSKITGAQKLKNFSQNHFLQSLLAQCLILFKSDVSFGTKRYLMYHFQLQTMLKCLKCLIQIFYFFHLSNIHSLCQKWQLVMLLVQLFRILYINFQNIHVPVFFTLFSGVTSSTVLSNPCVGSFWISLSIKVIYF